MRKIQIKKEECSKVNLLTFAGKTVVGLFKFLCFMVLILLDDLRLELGLFRKKWDVVRVLEKKELESPLLSALCSTNRAVDSCPYVPVNLNPEITFKIKLLLVEIAGEQVEILVDSSQFNQLSVNQEVEVVHFQGFAGISAKLAKTL